MPITLKSKPLKVEKIKKRTQAELFKKLKVGDLIQLSIEAEATGSNSRGNPYASYMKITNLNTNEFRFATFNQASFIMETNFEFMEVGDDNE